MALSAPTPPIATAEPAPGRPTDATAAASRRGRRALEGGAFDAVRRGEPFAADVHASLTAEDAVLEIDAFDLWYGRTQALHEVTMRIPRGKVTALVGPSGCGKSTLLRSVNRLNDLVDSVRTEGDMRLNGDSIYAPGVDVIELRKRIGMVFQKPNPFPMSVYENVVYSLRIDGERDRRVLDQVCEESLVRAGLWDEVRDRLSSSALALSGGQQQRLCIARAIAAAPEVLLLDEPCSALDPIATGRIEDLIEELKGGYSVLIVTHNMQQASRVSDTTAFLYLGRLIEHGPTSDIFLNPHRKETEDYVTGRFG
jgi:phosphate transport system ATP-binding protein